MVLLEQKRRSRSAATDADQPPAARPTAGSHLRALPLILAVSLLAVGCVAADQETASLDADASAEAELPASIASAADDAGQDLPELQGLEAELVADGFEQPVLVTGAPGTDALFVVERAGVVQVVSDPATGELADEPFLDITGQVESEDFEQGLLGLVFDPDFADNQTFYAYWTNKQSYSVLGRFTTEPDDPMTADVDSMEVVFEIEQPAPQHNSGGLQFGPDGLLYLSLGDGGARGDPGQDTTNLLGSILRFDLDGAAPGEMYAIPEGNPFGTEMWVYGLRNPWRFSIDAPSGKMYIGDVGLSSWEEINVIDLDDGAGSNFGWFVREGDGCRDPQTTDCPGDFVDPVLQYAHGDNGCSVIGGWVYRGSAIPELAGHYFYADWCQARVRSFRLTGQGLVTDQLDWADDLAAVGQATSFGLDNDRELHIVNWDGELYRIVPVR
ncbi:MAG: PQQ-dependent sugar dehydrogenase [Actinomycetota bacterium]